MKMETKFNFMFPVIQQSGSLSRQISTCKIFVTLDILFYLTVPTTLMQALSHNVTSESIPIIAEGLRLLKNFGGQQRWEPRYFIIDQSSAEEGAIEEVFYPCWRDECNSSILYHVTF